MSYPPSTFVEACNYMVRVLVETAFNMAANSVRPAGQPHPTGNEVTEFATVKIIDGPTGSFGSWSKTFADDPAAGSTKVIETLLNCYKFKAVIQFFRHGGTADTGGMAPFGLGAVDKACRLETMLASEACMLLMRRMGLGLEGSVDSPKDVGAMVDSARWEDRGQVTLSFAIVNREQFVVESFASASVQVRVQEPGKAQLTTETIEVTA